MGPLTLHRHSHSHCRSPLLIPSSSRDPEGPRIRGTGTSTSTERHRLPANLYRCVFLFLCFCFLNTFSTTADVHVSARTPCAVTVISTSVQLYCSVSGSSGGLKFTISKLKMINVMSKIDESPIHIEVFFLLLFIRFLD